MPRLAIEPSDEDRSVQAQVLSSLRMERLNAAKARGDREEERRWQLTATAARIGVSASNLGRYETGETILPSPYYRAVAEVYGLTRGQLVSMLGLTDDPPFDREAALAEIDELARLIPEPSISLADVGSGSQDWDDGDVGFILRRLRRQVAALRTQAKTAC